MEPAVVLPPPPEPVTFDGGVRLGGAFRIGDGPSFTVTGRAGSMVGIGLAVAPSPRFAVGLAYEHSTLGTEHGAGDLGTVDLSRSLDALWASLRLSLFRVDRLALGLTFGPGLVWQHVDANVIVFDGTAGRPDVFRCQETGGPGLGLRAGLGAEVRLGGGVFFTLDGAIDELRLSSDPLGSCTPGAGSTALVGVRAGFTYRLDVSRYVR